MCIRDRVCTIDISDTVESSLQQCVDTQYKRLVAVNRSGLPVGIINVSDVLSASAKGLGASGVSDLVFPLPQVSSLDTLSEILVKLFRSQNHMVGVIDDDGLLQGVITLSNVIEYLLD